MKTLVMSPENINKRKKFQKPNILRKKSAVKFAIPNQISLVPVQIGQPVTISQCCVDEENESNLKSTSSVQSSDKLNPVLQHLEKESIKNDNNKNCGMSGMEDYRNIKNDNANLALVKIKTFYNDTSEENDMDYETGKHIDTIMSIDKSPVNSMCIEESSDLITSMTPCSNHTTTSQDEEIDEASDAVPPQNNYTFLATIRKYKCDAPNCKNEFRSEQKLQKHKRMHNEDGTIKPARQVTVECPVKKIEPDGTEVSCGRIFLVRELLLKHLNEEHTPEDASYKCEECGRRFFWASGLRAHARAHCRRAGAPGPALVCSWSGCGRVFRQPCRLREHARAHTGDRPYHCQFPNCGWSFRSASKLERHARGHTGERRHRCGECARAFLRRDHLRDHHARHHAPRRAAHACTHTGCEQTFNNMSTLYMHMKKVHKSKEVSASETAIVDETLTLPLQQDESNTFVVNLVSDTGLGSAASDSVTVEAESGPVPLEAESKAESEWRAARTHCTWPLPRAPASPADAAPVHDQYVFSEQVDPSENSESNIYTVRSDLFLHGNVMINDDSEQSSGAVDGTNDALETDLGMLDAHPSGDLMQEELLYTDVAADESSFRIFLLSGEELT